MITVGSIENRDAQKVVMTKASKSAGWPVTKWGAITLIRMQPGAASMTSCKRGLMVRSRKNKKPAIRVA